MVQNFINTVKKCYTQALIQLQHSLEVQIAEIV